MSEVRNHWDMVCQHTDTCALTGSAAFFMGIPGSEVLVNGPLWCYFYALRYMERAGQAMTNRFFCTQPDRNALVYGTEEDLNRALEEARKRHPRQLLIQNNCSISLIGDDLKGIAARAALPFPVYTMDSGGMNGGFSGGFEKAFVTFLEGLSPSGIRIPEAVNLLGCTDFYLKGAEDTLEMKRLLRISGISVLTSPGSGSSPEELARCPEASLNLVVRDELGLQAARYMESHFGIPYLSVGMPYGTEGTLQWLKRVLEACSAGDSRAAGEEGARRRERMVRAGNEMQSMWGDLWFDRIAVCAPPSEASGIAQAVRSEWADTEKLTVIFRDPPHGEAGPPAADEILLSGEDAQKISDFYQSWRGGLLMAGSHEASRLMRLGRPFTACPIAHPCYDSLFLTDLPFCGLRGSEFLMERLWQAKVRECLAGGSR